MTEQPPLNHAEAVDRLMTIDEVCDYLQITIGTARKQRSEGRFVRGYRLGKHLRFRRSAVDKWLEEHADDDWS
ncbi:helix-turn-helix domain-containing protein [Cryptosporangium sp. NPDC051539]|uniref:helix-turn-helix domain-containing protein n=1 Tax=Cryptosporangium sp. NPDC051539 TaxID=3363962 RepID=UPI00379F7E72